MFTSDVGFREAEKFCEEALHLKQAGCIDGEDAEARYVRAKKIASPSKFYCQIPFLVFDEPCSVVDLRSEDEVIQQLCNFIHEGDPDDCWLSH